MKSTFKESSRASTAPNGIHKRDELENNDMKNVIIRAAAAAATLTLASAAALARRSFRVPA